MRGRIPTELNDDVAYRVGRGYAEFLSPKRVVVGRDIRLSSAGLADALCRGLTDSGVDVYDIGICGTEGVYFATFDGGYDGGIMVTASHNPPDYNGMKFVREQSKPISGDNGLQEIRALRRARRSFAKPRRRGRAAAHRHHARVHRASLVLRRCRRSSSRLKIVVNAGNGGAGLIVDQLEPHLPFEFIKVHHEPDGRFPNGIPNPMLEENRAPDHRRRSARTGRISGSPGTAISTAAFSSTSAARSSRAITSWDCWPRCCCAASPAARWCTIRG